jgi:hypothetical protein
LSEKKRTSLKSLLPRSYGDEMTDRLTLDGNDNYGEPRQEFADAIAAMCDDDFVRRAKDCIWLSAFANNNPSSDFHWKADACYSEAARRGKPELYKRAWEKAAER